MENQTYIYLFIYFFAPSTFTAVEYIALTMISQWTIIIIIIHYLFFFKYTMDYE